MDDGSPSKSHSASSDSADVRTGLGKPEAPDPPGPTLTLSPLKSIQPYRTQDEFLVAMKEDLAEWLNSAYDLDMDWTSLFTQLATGVLLCRHANAFNAVAAKDLGAVSLPRRNSGFVTSASGFNPTTSGSGPPTSASGFSASGACPSSSVAAAPFSAVAFRDGVHPGSFKSRDNIANFLGWCRHSLGLRDTLLFETEDLVQGRNERNVVLCLLEVARRGARLGMAAPCLVRLEAEIDAEIARDEAAATAAAATRRPPGDDGEASPGLHGNSTCLRRHGNDGDDEARRLLLQMDDRHGNSLDGGKTRDVEVQTMDESQMESAAGGAVSPPPPGSRPTPAFLLLRRSSFDSISSSSDSSSVRGGGGGGGTHPHHPHSHHHPHHQAPAAAIIRPRKHVIEVDMMSLDEMVRNILNKCTCEFQYPMIRVSEGKYKIGDSLTLIFVRILRNHVMVRIGGGWDTLENYLHRHDPCRMETRVTKSSSSQLRLGAHTCGGVGAGGVAVGRNGVGGTEVGGTGVGGAGEEWRDGSFSCDTSSKVENDGGSCEEKNSIPETSIGYAVQNEPSSNRFDDSVVKEFPVILRRKDGDLTRDIDPSQQSPQFEADGCISDKADRSSDGRTADVACQTDDPTRRYSSSSGASSWESASRDERCGRVGGTGRVDVTLDDTAQRDFEGCDPSRIEYSNGSSAKPPCSRQDYNSEREAGLDNDQSGGVEKPAVSGLGCPQCGQSAAVGKQTAGLCRLCRQRRGQLRPGSAKGTRQLPQYPSATSQCPVQLTSCKGSVLDRQLRTQRPVSAQLTQKHLPGPDLEAQLGNPRPGSVVAAQRPSSAQSQRQRTVVSASAQKQRRRTLGPAAIQEHVAHIVGNSSSARGQVTLTGDYAMGREPSVRELRRNSLGPTHAPGKLLHQTPLTGGFAQDPLEQQRTRLRTQRPASAQENRHFKRSKAEEAFIYASTPGNKRPLGANPRCNPTVLSKTLLTSPPKAAVAPVRTKSQEDLRTDDCSAANRASPGDTPFQRRTNLRSTISSHGDRQLIRELFRMKKLDASCTYDIPELVELSSDDLPLLTPSQGPGPIRERKDVSRTGSFSKIPKPVALN